MSALAKPVQMPGSGWNAGRPRQVCGKVVDVRMPPFESEYDAAALPKVTGDPLSHRQLDAHVQALPPGRRLESSQQDLILDAVHAFYLAKKLYERLSVFDNYINAVAPSALDAISHNLIRLGVIAVAAANDAGRNARTKSLPHTLDAIDAALETTGGEVTTERNRLRQIKLKLDPEEVQSIKYVNHVSNKWAGHASLDRDFDDWAQADSVLSFPLIEDALVRLVNAHQELADLVDSSAVMRELLKEPKIIGDETLPQIIEFRVEWKSVTVLASVLREWAGRAAEAIVDQLESPPGYGTAEDTDWRPGSEHSRRRALIDEAAKRALMSEPRDAR